MEKKNITLGADPEIFIENDVEIVSAEGLTEGGSKHFPRPISEVGHAIQEDGIMFEYNIPPSATEEEWVENHKFCLDYLEILANANGYKLSNVVSAEINPRYLQTPQATTFGCEPDFNAWTKQINPRPLASDWQLRSAGGHIHIGTKEDPIEVIRAMDLFVGVPSIIKDPGGERRRELYGMPGAYRIKPFGCEYRVLSNFWIFSRELVEWVYNQTAKAIDFVESGETIDPKHAAVIQECIIKSNKDAYEFLADTYGITQ